MTEKMTIAQATVFSHKSLASELVLNLAAKERGCSCAAYSDWFTYRRWQALGFQVQRADVVGHGVKLTTYVEFTKTDPATGEQVVTGKRPRTTSVFCRCQVKPIEKKEQH